MSSHETYSQGEIKPPSPRSTGLVFAVMAGLVAVWWRHSPSVLWTASSLASILLAISLIAPQLLKPLNIVWFRFSMLLHRVVNPVVMFVIFALVFVPAGVLMRVWRDPLRSKRSLQAPTYWIERRDNAEAPQSMTNQF